MNRTRRNKARKRRRARRRYVFLLSPANMTPEQRERVRHLKQLLTVPPPSPLLPLLRQGSP